MTSAGDDQEYSGKLFSDVPRVDKTQMSTADLHANITSVGKNYRHSMKYSIFLFQTLYSDLRVCM
jgi:hypothetical protein